MRTAPLARIARIASVVRIGTDPENLIPTGTQLDIARVFMLHRKGPPKTGKDKAEAPKKLDKPKESSQRQEVTEESVSAVKAKPSALAPDKIIEEVTKLE